MDAEAKPTIAGVESVDVESDSMSVVTASQAVAELTAALSKMSRLTASSRVAGERGRKEEERSGAIPALSNPEPQTETMRSVRGQM